MERACVASAFAGCKPVASSHGGAEAAPVEGLSIVSVTAWRDAEPALIEAMQSAFALALPEAGRWTHAGDLVAMWVGPGHWWLQREAGGLLLPEIAAAAADRAGLIDISDARATLRIHGPAARDILASLLPIDLHPRALAPGRVASTIAAHIGVQLRQIDVAPSYDLSCLRSYAGSLWRALELAGAGRIRMGVGELAETAAGAVSPGPAAGVA